MVSSGVLYDGPILPAPDFSLWFCEKRLTIITEVCSVKMAGYWPRFVLLSY